MTDKDDKLNALRANALEMELRKPKRDNGMDAEIEYQADALAHDDRPRSASMMKSANLIVFIIIGIVIAIMGLVIFLMFGSSGTSHDSNSDKNICRTQCNDGTCSPSTGPGTCSYHGGIKTD